MSAVPFATIPREHYITLTGLPVTSTQLPASAVNFIPIAGPLLNQNLDENKSSDSYCSFSVRHDADQPQSADEYASGAVPGRSLHEHASLERTPLGGVRAVGQSCDGFDGHDGEHLPPIRLGLLDVRPCRHLRSAPGKR